MLFFGHIGITLAAARIIASKTETQIDYRIVAIGSMLPDIIDKPIYLLAQGGVPTGRLWTHSLLLVGILFIAGYHRYAASRRNGLLVLASAVLAHDLLDTMWVFPQIFLWPFLGVNFTIARQDNWMGAVIDQILHNPAVYIPEIAGAVFVMYMGIRLWRDGVLNFLRSGRYN